MTIKEAESLTGMPRASIRFYEAEGLLCPQREKNGHRIYTQEHVDILLRIRLLRALVVSVGRRASCGDTGAGDAAQTQRLAASAGPQCGLYHLLGVDSGVCSC